MADKNAAYSAITELNPAKYLEIQPEEQEDGALDGNKDSNPKAALIILNSPLTDLEYFARLYSHASFRVCADGGANRLHDLLAPELPGGSEETEALRRFPPDLIHGDLDSLHDAVRKQYEQIGVEVSRDPDQYSTDFGKCTKVSIERMPEVRDVLVLGSLGGRVDQGIGLLHELYREQVVRHPDVRFWLFSEASVSTILQAGSTVIRTPVKAGLITRNIGILPLYGPARLSTKGLEWDVQDWPTEMGGQVSTSNHIMSDRITISTDKEVLFTVERALNR